MGRSASGVNSTVPMPHGHTDVRDEGPRGASGSCSAWVHHTCRALKFKDLFTSNPSLQDPRPQQSLVWNGEQVPVKYGEVRAVTRGDAPQLLLPKTRQGG